MGNVTTNLQIWTPDDEELNEPDVYLATMAASIENGAGKRITKLETNASVLANLSSSQTFVNGTGQIVANTVGGLGYNDGMTITGGSVKITVAGLYLINWNNTAIAADSTSGGSALVTARKNGVTIGASLAPIAGNGSTAVGVASGTATSICKVNDTLDVYCVFAGATKGVLTLSAANTAYNTFSVTLIKAT